MRVSFRTIAAGAGVALALSTVALPAFAQGLGGAQTELENAGKKAYGTSVVNRSLEVVAGEIINAFLSLFGILFLALMVYGGYLWMNARGNDQQVEKAKSLITAAVIGLVIALSGYIVTRFVVSGILTATTGAGEAAPAEAP
ncbi:MAG: hypothetical protein AAB974_00575 [Patescibacteria group bacterium]